MSSSVLELIPGENTAKSGEIEEDELELCGAEAPCELWVFSVLLHREGDIGIKGEVLDEAQELASWELRGSRGDGELDEEDMFEGEEEVNVEVGVPGRGGEEEKGSTTEHSVECSLFSR